MTKPKIFQLNIIKPTDKQEEQKKTKKSNLPDMGSYNPDKSEKALRKGSGYS